MYTRSSATGRRRDLRGRPEVASSIVAGTTVQNNQAEFAGSRRILAVADTDSYLKWSSATLSALPAGWHRSQLVIRNPVMPSAEQMQAVSSLPVDLLSRA